MHNIYLAQVCEGLDFLKSGRLSVHSSFLHAVNLKSDGCSGLFSLVSFDKPLVPNGAVIGVEELPFAEAGRAVEVVNGRLIFNEFSIDLSTAKTADLTVDPWLESKDEASRLIGLIDLTISGRKPGIAKLEEFGTLDSAVSEVVGGLVGLGPGLTPSGDDFICGWMWAWRSCGDARFSELAAAASSRLEETTDASSNFMRLASSGRFAAALKIVQKHPEEGFRWMAEQGSSSGIDTLFGARFGLMNSKFE